MLLGNKLIHSDRFKVVFDRYSKPMFLYALSFVETEAEAEDIVQDIFYHYWRTDAWKRIEEGAEKTYLFRSVKNACLNYKEKKDVLHNRVDLAQEPLIDEVYEEPDEELLQRIRRDIEGMAPQTREIIRAIFYQNKKYQEVADQLGISVNTVKTLLRRAMHSLRDRYADSLLLYLFFIFS